MTREEMRENAIAELNSAFERYKNHVMNIVDRAWAEGKRNAETEKAEEIGKDILKSVMDKLTRNEHAFVNVTGTTITGPSMLTYKGTKDGELAPDIPNACKECSNHPINGGSGICHCTLGSQINYCTTGDAHE